MTHLQESIQNVDVLQVLKETALSLAVPLAGLAGVVLVFIIIGCLANNKDQQHH